MVHRVHVPNRVSIPQLEFLARCIEQFPLLAPTNTGKSREETSRVHKQWLQIGSALNKIKPGVTKTGKEWLRYWTIYKYQLRKKYPQFQSSWVSQGPVQVTPLERRFLQVLSDHEKNEASHLTSDQNGDSYTTTDEEEKSLLTTNYIQQETSQPMQTKQEIAHAMPTVQKISPPIPTRQENSQAMPTKQEISQSMPTMQIVDVSRERDLESPDALDDNNNDDDDNRHGNENNSSEDPNGTEEEIKEEMQIEILKFNLKRQREMHELEMAQMQERHRLEIELLQIKKKKLLQDCDRLKNMVKLRK